MIVRLELYRAAFAVCTLFHEGSGRIDARGQVTVTRENQIHFGY